MLLYGFSAEGAGGVANCGRIGLRGFVSRHDMSSCARMSWRLRGGAVLVFAFLAVTAFGRPASAETLEQALSDAYLINPVLNAERARLRATDEQVALAKSGLRPLITGEADWNYVNQNSDRVTSTARPTTSSQATTPPLPNPILEAIRQSVLQTVRQDLAAQNAQNAQNAGQFSTTDGVTHPHGYSIQLTQPLFEGFQNLNAIRGAKSTVQAARESLRSVEQTVLLDAVTAYVNVVRDTAIVRLRENDVTVLTEQLKATKDRFDVGEVTRTDVAQAEARRSEALSTLAAAQAQPEDEPRRLRADHPTTPRATSRRPLSIRHLLPRTLDESMTLGDGENPIILAAVYQEEASLYAVEQIMGELLPQVTLEAQYQNRFDQSKFLTELETTTVMGRVNVPLLSRRWRLGPGAPGQGDQQPVEEGGRGFKASRACRRDLQLGHLAVLGSGHRCGPSGRQCQQDRAHRRARGGEGRAAHHARCPQCQRSS